MYYKLFWLTLRTPQLHTMHFFSKYQIHLRSALIRKKFTINNPVCIISYLRIKRPQSSYSCNMENNNMINTEYKKESNRKYSIWYFIGIWLVYASLYYSLKTYGSHKEYAGLLSTSGDTILNILMIISNWWLWKNSPTESKRVFGYFILSFSFVTIPNALYQILFNVLNIKAQYFDGANTQLVIHHIMYAICLVFEFAAWATIATYIFSANSKPNHKNYRAMAIIVGTLILSFLGVLAWKTNNTILSTDRYFETHVTTFYITNFTLAILSLVVCKSRSLFYLALGYLIIIGADLIMAFGFMSQKFGIGSLFDTVWFLGLIIMLHGILSFKKTGDYQLEPLAWISESNSIKTQSAVWSFILCTVSLGVFLTASGFFNSANFFLIPI